MENLFNLYEFNFDITLDIFNFLVFTKYMGIIKKIRHDFLTKFKDLNDYISKNKEYILTYDKYLPYNDDFMSSKNSSLCFPIKEERYKYAYYNPLEKEKHIHYFDSKTEYETVRSFYDLIRDAEIDKDKIKV
ncbi:UNVERIFIED_CONTAM: hypothetical protein O8I53_09375 [Campylobacter lari]